MLRKVFSRDLEICLNNLYFPHRHKVHKKLRVLCVFVGILFLYKMIKFKNFLLVFLLFTVVSCINKNQTEQLSYQENTGKIFNTYYKIKYEYNRSLENEIQAELQKFDNSLNPFNKNSIITHVNRNNATALDSFFIEVFNKAMEVSRNSSGAFDITLAPLVNLWGFGFENIENVNQQTIDSIMQFVGYEKITIEDGNIVKSDPRVMLNMSAIAKGYAVDVVSRLLERHSIENHMCEIGGEIRMSGVNDKGKCWLIGLEKPIDDNTGLSAEIQTTLRICNKSIATSGNYRNYYIKDGKKYSHTINPKTGYPSEQNILSTTVIADDCMTADAYATAFMVLGLEESLTLINTLPNIYAYFIYVDEDSAIQSIFSDGFEQFLVE